MRVSFKMQAPIPTRTASAMTHPCTVTLWPMVTISPTWTGYIFRMPWRTAQSCILLRGPMRMAFTSPRTTVFIQMLLYSPNTTSPMTCAEGSMKQLGALLEAPSETSGSLELLCRGQGLRPVRPRPERRGYHVHEIFPTAKLGMALF